MKLYKPKDDYDKAMQNHTFYVELLKDLHKELINKGFNSRSWMSWQIPINTEGKYKFSRINKINKSKKKCLKYVKINK